VIIAGLDIPNIYWCGVLGSAGVELAAALQAASANEGIFPPKYKKWTFLLFRGIFALIAGVVPIALDAQNIWSAIYLGASAPLIFDRAARGLQAPSEGR
jgi:hypothetical protein